MGRASGGIKEPWGSCVEGWGAADRCTRQLYVIAQEGATLTFKQATSKHGNVCSRWGLAADCAHAGTLDSRQVTT